MSLCPLCMAAWKKHQCNTCRRRDCIRRTDGHSVIVDECRGYFITNDLPIHKKSNSCKKCGTMLRGTHLIQPDQSTFVYSVIP